MVLGPHDLGDIGPDLGVQDGRVARLGERVDDLDQHACVPAGRVEEFSVRPLAVVLGADTGAVLPDRLDGAEMGLGDVVSFHVQARDAGGGRHYLSP